jgi:hypothetical protein
MGVTRRLIVPIATPNRMIPIGEGAPHALRPLAQRATLVLEPLGLELPWLSKSPMAMTMLTKTTRPWNMRAPG